MQRSWLATAGAAVLIVLRFVPSADAQQPLRLTLKDAIQLGLKANFSVLSSATRFREAGGTSERRFSDLLPKSYIETSWTLEKINLAALGIDIPFLKPGVGPFAAYDFRVNVNQPILDLQTYQSWKSSQPHEQAARDDYQDSRDLVIRTVASLYLNAESAAALVDSLRARRAAQYLADTTALASTFGVQVLRTYWLLQAASEKLPSRSPQKAASRCGSAAS